MPFVNERKSRIVRRLFEASNGDISAMQRNAHDARLRAEERRCEERAEDAGKR